MDPMSPSSQWWSSLPDECPITLEPLSTLPYPPFILTHPPAKTSSAGMFDNAAAPSPSSKNSNDNDNCKKYYFDGLALATYVISQGTFANPLTREALTYGDCVRLDDYLSEHIYSTQNNNNLQVDVFSQSILSQNNGRISVSEAFALRDSIKVKVLGGGNNTNNSEEQRRRAETLRNEAAAALRGLFVFGHERQRGNIQNSVWENSGENSRNSQALPRAEGGFNLYYVPDSSTSHSWGLESVYEQQGLQVIDDDEAAFESADLDAWRQVQEAFPFLSCSDDNDNAILTPNQRVACNENDVPSSDLLQTVRQTADLTNIEEREKAARINRQRQRYFFEALERKRNRILEQKRAKEEAASALMNKKHEEDQLQSARNEIDRWRAKQWENWERAASKYESKKKETEEAVKVSIESKQSANNDIIVIQTTLENNDRENQPNEKLSAEQRAAAKKAAKRQKAKERAKEKKRLERLEKEKEERALAIQKEKELSALKCGACGDGILDCGFEKFGVRFCSARCARNGPSGSTTNK